MNSRIPSTLRFLLLIPCFAACSASGAIVWGDVTWFSWTSATNPEPSVGTAIGQSIAATVTGTHAANPGIGSSMFDTDLNGSFEMLTSSVGLGAPRANSIATYTLDLSSLTLPTSQLVIGIANLDAINGRGSLRVTALDNLDVAVNANNWATAGQFKQQAGIPSAQALVTRSELGNSIVLGSVQGPDNTSWGDSRGIFFSGLEDNLGTITFSHQYNHPNATVSDSITLYVGIIPEPASAFLVGLGSLAFLGLIRNRHLGKN